MRTWYLLVVLPYKDILITIPGIGFGLSNGDPVGAVYPLEASILISSPDLLRPTRQHIGQFEEEKIWLLLG